MAYSVALLTIRRSRSSVRRRAASASLRSVTSLAVPIHSVISPRASNSGMAREKVQPIAPSTRMI